MSRLQTSQNVKVSLPDQTRVLILFLLCILLYSLQGSLFIMSCTEKVFIILKPRMFHLVDCVVRLSFVLSLSLSPL